MIICSLNEGIYEGNLAVTNKEIENREVMEVIQMGICLMKIDVMLEEVQGMRTNTADQALMYKLLEDENNNIMSNGGIWRGRALETIRNILMNILQASKILETFDTHQKVLENFIKMNGKKEGQEFVVIGWVESFEKQVKIKVKMTKRSCEFIPQRLEIFKMKMQIIRSCKENEYLGKIYFIGVIA